jgi:hypothetical protein
MNTGDAHLPLQEQRGAFDQALFEQTLRGIDPTRQREIDQRQR